MARRCLPFLPWLAVVGILAGVGVVQGRHTGRWSTSTDLADAVRRLDRLPLRVGTWQGQDVASDAGELQRAGILGAVQRSYRDTQTGANLMVLLVCGRPGPISVHTPDVCYTGAGYEMAAAPIEPFPGFRAAAMIRPDAAVSDGLHVYWSWNASGAWEAPESPRLRFASAPSLYKLYVIRHAASSDQNLADGTAPEFLKTLVAALDLTSSDPVR